jgi:hypothetical protein
MSDTGPKRYEVEYEVEWIVNGEFLCKHFAGREEALSFLRSLPPTTAALVRDLTPGASPTV